MKNSKKKTSLSAALQRVASPHSPARSPQAPSLPPSRRGKKPVTGFFDPSVSRHLKQLALEKNTTLQQLLGEAINDLLSKYGRPPVA